MYTKAVKMGWWVTKNVQGFNRGEKLKDIPMCTNVSAEESPAAESETHMTVSCACVWKMMPNVATKFCFLCANRIRNARHFYSPPCSFSVKNGPSFPITPLLFLRYKVLLCVINAEKPDPAAPTNSIIYLIAPGLLCYLRTLYAILGTHNTHWIKSKVGHTRLVLCLGDLLR